MFELRLLMRSGWQGGPRAAELPADEQATWTGYRLSLGQNADINGSNAAIAVGCARELCSRCLAGSCQLLPRERSGINDMYRGVCSHPA